MKRLHTAIIAIALLASCNNESSTEKENKTDSSTAGATTPKEGEHTAGYSETRNPYFGQTHQHTGWSFDAYIMNVQLGPDNAYRYAMGEKVKHPNGEDVQLKIPLDFMGVTDHAEYLGILRMFADSTNPISKNPIAGPILKANKDKDVKEATKAFYGLVKATIQADGSTKPDPTLNTPELKRSNWDAMIAYADEFYKPGKFTTFASFEWSSQPFMSNLHRNIFFRTTKGLPVPYSYFDSEKPEDLWKWMDQVRANGISILAIPHNGNLSNGLMYPTENDSYGKPISRAYAESRQRNEPLTEILQIKGQSETHPMIAPNDEFAYNFEMWTKPVAGPGTVKVKVTNYVRNALENGLVLEKKLGVNPYKYGFVGGSDAHTSIVPHEEYAYTGEHNLKSSSPHARLLESNPGEPSKIEQGSAGLSCVWADENTREAIYDAFARKETWATSGTRITVRYFAGWDFAGTTPDTKDWAKVGYKDGVPMGSDMSAAVAGKSPMFMIWALKGPNDGNLDRIQVIKGWVDKNGKAQEKIFNVAWSGDRKPDAKGKLPPVGTTVDLKTATYTNTIGSNELKTVWTDPEFDAGLPAFYYLRVLEIPTPRWSTYDAVKLGIDPPKGFPATIQERAWTSPVWYNPK